MWCVQGGSYSSSIIGHRLAERLYMHAVAVLSQHLHRAAHGLMVVAEITKPRSVNDRQLKPSGLRLSNANDVACGEAAGNHSVGMIVFFLRST